MQRIIVTGIGTDVGKTLTAAILTTLYQGIYWKPIQTGSPSDSHVVKNLTNQAIHPSRYTFQTPVSPHHAAKLEGIEIDLTTLTCPSTTKPLIIEGAGGVCSPITFSQLNIDMFKLWDCPCVVVSRHYLGSINHMLMSLHMLKLYQIPILGIIFNGNVEPESEAVILSHTSLPCIGRILPEVHITKSIIHQYAKQWSPCLCRL